jgi:hypothetical protein
MTVKSMKIHIPFTFAAIGVMSTSAESLRGLKKCTTIQSGELKNSIGEIIETGFDDWGYNYQAHMFSGGYCDAYRDAEWCQDYKDDSLLMKWNDAWLSNKDCNEDKLLDRHYGYETYIGSGAWLTNHISGEYENQDEETCSWNQFIKIVAAPVSASKTDGIWYDDVTNEEIGSVIWEEFAIIQQVDNDPCGGLHGVTYKATRPGLGNWEDN